ncbi:MAG TPA: DUF6011 domain-containing protein [Anaerolineales bacterium]|nr:DUF6011 domain-containing protein [Anaerolineales bacterium]
MQPRCKKCGRPLSSPESIARGMGPECAGISSSRKNYVPARKRNGSGSTYEVLGKKQITIPMFSWMDSSDMQEHLPDQLIRFPSDLLYLVLSAPARGEIAMRVKNHKQNSSKGRVQSPILTLREIRRACINLRLLFWPGFSFKGEPLACIPCGDDNWRIGNDGREISVSDLVAYLSRYGAI